MLGKLGILLWCPHMHNVIEQHGTSAKLWNILLFNALEMFGDESKYKIQTIHSRCASELNQVIK
jgi:hypothetical protein